MALEEWVINHADFAKYQFPKLPVHFRNHEERFDRNERGLIVFEQSKNVRGLMAALNPCPLSEHGARRLKMLGLTETLSLKEGTTINQRMINVGPRSHNRKGCSRLRLLHTMMSTSLANRNHRLLRIPKNNDLN
jgi:hypothetical protein